MNILREMVPIADPGEIGKSCGNLPQPQLGQIDLSQFA